MQSGGRFVKDEHYPLLAVARLCIVQGQEIRQFDSLALASRKGAAALPELDI